MVRLYIADTDRRFTADARKALARGRQVEVVGESDSGRRALYDIQRLRPDAVLTDIQLPELDGIALLRDLRRMRSAPAVIVCTRFYSQASMEWAFRYGASFFLCKPIDFERLTELVVDCAREAAPSPAAVDEANDEQSRRAEVVRLLLRELGISPKLNGSAYLVESVLRARENGLLLRNLTRGLYVELADRLDTTVPRVERSLRSAIDIAYERGSLSRRFPSRPSNKQFIEYLLRESEAPGERHAENF